MSYMSLGLKYQKLGNFKEVYFTHSFSGFSPLIWLQDRNGMDIRSWERTAAHIVVGSRKESEKIQPGTSIFASLTEGLAGN